MTLSNGEIHAEARDSTFCLEPQGDTPSRSQIFECLMTGSIPVFFSSCAQPDLVYERLYAPFLPPYERQEFGPGLWAVVLSSERAVNEPTYVMDELQALRANKTLIKAMRAVIIAAMPRLVYREAPHLSSDVPIYRKSDASWTDSTRYQPDALAVLHDTLVDRGILSANSRRGHRRQWHGERRTGRQRTLRAGDDHSGGGASSP
jgi:hypothetical protein